jgi:hypothetical protein
MRPGLLISETEVARASLPSLPKPKPQERVEIQIAGIHAPPFPQRNGHNRLWKIARRICDQYQGDARNIWEGRDSRSVLEALWELGAGDQMSRMIVGALRDCGLMVGVTSDVKGNVYVLLYWRSGAWG